MTDFTQIKKIVKDALKQDHSGHDFGHACRVHKLALQIAKFEKGVDLEILKASALLHDMAFSKGFFEGEHGDVSAKVAEPILLKLGFPKAKIGRVLEAITLHNYWFHNEKDVPIEVKILRDADRLELLGYIGILREILYCSNSKTNIDKGLKDLLILEEQFETKKGKELSKKRIKVIQDFIANLRQEMD